jgi:2-phosphosulfolactate phosphatase
MNIEVILLPEHLHDRDLSRHTVIVFDVLRATTTITAAFAAGIRMVRIFDSVGAAQSAAQSANPRPLLCGEIKTLPPPGFDFGNSPRQFLPEHVGRDVFLATTNGTRAAYAARSAAQLFAGALVNAPAVAAAAARARRDIILLCSGTAGEISLEDTIGCGAVCHELLARGDYSLAEDASRIAHRLFQATRDGLAAALATGQGGHNIIAAGLEPDIEFAARVGVFSVVPLATSDASGIVFRPIT